MTVCTSCPKLIGRLGGGMKKRESPDFRFPGVGISAASVVPWLMASRKVPMDIYVVVNFLSQIICIFSFLLTSLEKH